MNRLAHLPQAVKTRLRQFSGDDRTSLFFNLIGGSGTFSIAANIAPRLVSGLHDALRSGDVKTARLLDEKLGPVFDIIAREPTPSVIKCALRFLHGMSDQTRLPLTCVEPTMVDAIRNLLDTLPTSSPIPVAAA